MHEPLVGMTLASSPVCRFCCEENDSGVPLFDDDLAVLANTYLPLKISDDGKLPRTICPGCHIQLQATVSFFNLIIDGQKKLRQLRQAEIVEEQKFEFLQKNLGLVDASKGGVNDTPDQTVTLEDLTEVMQLGQSLFSADDLITLRMEGIEKPKRKRGRPRKDSRPPAEVSEKIQTAPAVTPQPVLLEDLSTQEVKSTDGKVRRKRKLPSRYQEGVQGKELERILKEEGIYDDIECSDRDPQVSEIIDIDPSSDDLEVIGHIETKEGIELGNVILNKVIIPNTSLQRKVQFQCDVCSQTFTQQTRFLEHKADHVTPRPIKPQPVKEEEKASMGMSVSWYRCDGCEEKFMLKEEVLEHTELTGHSAVVDSQGGVQLEPEEAVQKLVEGGENEKEEEVGEQKAEDEQAKYSCPLCRKKFRFNSSLNEHMLSCHKTKSGGYPCDICGHRLKHLSSIIYHKKTRHSDGRRFVCHKCGKCFKHRQLLKRHQLVHSERRPHYCKQCGASFKTKANLANHQATHSDIKKFFCEICGNQFAHKTSLTLHYRWHLGDKPYQCDICKKSFTQKGNLQEHVRIHTGEKPFSCQVCSRRFTTSSQHKLHLKRHTGERPFKCPHCDKCFLHRDTWKCHVRRHTGDRPFGCQHCSKQFPEMWALKKHLRLHTGERPYSCNICGKAFADCSNLKKHKKVHMKDSKFKKDVVDSRLENGSAVIPSDSVSAVGLHFMNNLSVTESDTVPSGQQDVNTVTSMESVAAQNSIQQLIYVTYQEQSDTVTKMSEKYFDVPGLDVKNDDEIEIPSSMMQVMDEHGNPIHLTLQDGTQLQVTTSDGKTLQVTTNQGQAIPVRLTTTEGVPLSTTLTPVQTGLSPDVSKLVMEKEELNQINDPGSMEFVTSDNQAVRMLVTVNPSSMRIPSPYLIIS